LELGQGNVLGVQRVRPPELVGDLPGDVLQDMVAEQPDPQPAHVAQPQPGILLGHLAAAYRLVQERKQLRAQQRRSQKLMIFGYHGLVMGELKGDLRADHVFGHGRSVPLAASLIESGTPRMRARTSTTRDR